MVASFRLLFSHPEGGLRCLLVLGATGVLAVLLAQFRHLPVPLTLSIYVGWTLASTLAAFIALQTVVNTERGYAWFFGVTLAPAGLCCVILTARFGMSLGWTYVWLAVPVFAFFAGLMAFCTERQFVSLHLCSQIALFQGFVLSVCGVMTLVSLIPPCSALEFRLRMGLGLYWLVIGLYSLVDSIGILRSRALFESVNSWFPATACIVILGLLAFSLRGQRELSRQPQLYEPAVMEQVEET